MISLLAVTRENFPRLERELLSIEQSSFPSPWDGRSFSNEIDREISHFWAAIIDDVLVGYICFWIFAGEVHLLNIAVHGAWRRKGLGRRLLSKMFEIGRHGHAETAWLEVRPSNLAARALYGQVGFREVGHRPRYYTDTHEDAILMSMALNPGGDVKGQSGKELEKRP